MHTLPPALLSSLRGIKGFDAETFTNVHAGGSQGVSIRVNPLKLGERVLSGGEVFGDCRLSQRVPWSSYGYYLEERPSFTFDPRFHAGAYYVQEASSMFLEQALRQTAGLSRPLRVLDCCAAPGGKSTLILSLISPDSLLVSNEVIRTRVNVLQENLVKWGASNTIITHNDPRDFGRMENYFDVMVVDAPCSGSGLFRRDPEAIGQWSPENVQLCHQRQQRILSDCWPALGKDGVLIYSTCSYSREENEDILDWIMEETGAESCRLQLDASWNIIETTGEKGGWGYRFYPDSVRGEGFFIACLRKTDGGDFSYPKSRKPALEKLTRQQEQSLLPWIRPDAGHSFFLHQELVHGLPAALMDDLVYLQSSCYLKKAGVVAGAPAVKEFIPEHDLALSTLLSGQIPVADLAKDQAIRYLRKEEIRKEDLAMEPAHKGWVLARYEGSVLGWLKVLPNRVNNYYPKEWRILKRSEGS